MRDLSTLECFYTHGCVNNSSSAFFFCFLVRGKRNTAGCIQSEAQNVEGEYRLNGVIHNPNKRLKVSICKDIFYVDRQWHSDSGFQQLVLVYNGKARTFRDSRKFVRRALCKMGEHVFLVESSHRMTLTDFAAECAKVSSNAVYLDMGKYGYGYIGNRILSP